MDISSLVSGYTDNATSTTSTSNLENTLDSDLSNASESEMLDACKQFEQYFLEQIMKEMEKTIPDSEEETSSATSSMKDYIKDSLIEQYAEVMTNTNDGEGIGLAQQLYESMKRTYGGSTSTTSGEDTASASEESAVETV